MSPHTQLQCTYRRLHSINILQQHADTHIQSITMNTKDQLSYIIHPLFLPSISINCFDRPLWSFLNVFPQKRKCYFYPQCMPLSLNAAGLDSYRGCPTINILSLPVKHTHVQKTHDGKAGRDTNVSVLLFLQQSRVETLAHTQPVGCHFLSSILSNSRLPVCKPFSKFRGGVKAVAEPTHPVGNAMK